MPESGGKREVPGTATNGEIKKARREGRALQGLLNHNRADHGKIF